MNMDDSEILHPSPDPEPQPHPETHDPESGPATDPPPEPLDSDQPPAVPEKPDPVMSSPNLPELPKHELELSIDSIINIGASAFDDAPEMARVQRRASNVLKLSQENEKLNAELKAMSDRLEAAEKKRMELERRMGQKGDGNASS